MEERGEDISKQEVYSIAAQVVRGMCHLHRHGVVHLDIKAGNLIFDRATGLLLSLYSTTCSFSVEGVGVSPTVRYNDGRVVALRE